MMASHRIIASTVVALAIGQLVVLASCSGSEDVAAAGPTAGRETRRVVDAMIEAHGGLAAWSSAPTVSFECTFLPAGASSPIVSREVIEQGARRAYIDYPGTQMRLAWDGERAWSESWNGPYPPRFMALLNYYFVNLPWLAMDPGVILGDPGSGRLWDDPTEYVTIKMTFEPGVGDTPDDYYVLFVHPTSNRLKACRYIVTYTEILPEGMESTPEHTLVYDELVQVDGLMVPTRCSIYELDQTPYASIDVGAWSFRKPFDASRMSMPEGAVIDTSER